jgi:aminoglycoside 6'-N-acetyltransferase
MLYQVGDINVRKLQKKDNILLAKWLSDPAVLEFYEGRDNPFDIEKVNRVFYDSGVAKGQCIVEYVGKEIGYVQFYLLDDETKKVYGYGDENIYGMDQFIGETNYWGKGIGKLLVTSMMDYLINSKKATKVVMDPQTRNLRALKCYEKCGFKKVKLLPERELHEGKYQDCWLIEYNAN